MKKGGSSMKKYLISDVSYLSALDVSEAMGLNLNEWIYVPSNVSTSRRGKVLMGNSVSSEKYLVGIFTSEEREYLTRKRRVDNMKIDIKTLDIIIDSFKKKEMRDNKAMMHSEGELKAFKLGRIEALDEAKEVLEIIKESLE